MCIIINTTKSIYPNEKNGNEIFCGKYTGELKAMTCLVHAEAYQKLLVTVHSKDGLSCHVSPSEVQIQHFSADHNVSVLMKKSHWESVCKISVFITVLFKHSFLKLRSVFLGSGLRLPTWFHFVRFCSWFLFFRPVKVHLFFFFFHFWNNFPTYPYFLCFLCKRSFRPHDLDTFWMKLRNKINFQSISGALYVLSASPWWKQNLISPKEEMRTCTVWLPGLLHHLLSSTSYPLGYGLLDLHCYCGQSWSQTCLILSLIQWYDIIKYFVENIGL